MQLMNKFLIPAILTAVVLIAGIFAFMPVDKASTVHTQIIAAITDSQDAVLLDLEKKLKLSADSDGPTNPAPINGEGKLIFIRSIDNNTGERTTFNLKECYLEGTIDNSGKDDIQVQVIFLDQSQLFNDIDGGFTSFGPFSDAAPGTGDVTFMVELLVGLGFPNGLGAMDEIRMDVQIDEGDFIKRIFCIAFVQNSADLVVTISVP